MDSKEHFEIASQLESAGLGEVQTQEQEGGRVLMRDGKPVALGSLSQIVATAYQGLFEHYAWFGVLAETAIYNGGANPGGAAKFVTPYGDDATGTHPDEAKHRAYIEHVGLMIGERQPWFWPMLHAARAMVMLSPEGCTFALSTRPGLQFDVPMSKEILALTPFRDDAETMH